MKKIWHLLVCCLVVVNAFSLQVYTRKAPEYAKSAVQLAPDKYPTHAPADVVNPPRLSPNAQTLYSHGDPTNEEQLMLEYINRARMNPAAEADSFYNTTAPEVVSWYASAGVNKNQTRSEFKSYTPKQPLAFHEKIIAAARAHTTDMISKQFFSHTGSDGSSPFQRMAKTGYTATGGMGENIAYSQSVWMDNVILMIDWNYPGLGHRHNLMSFSPTDIVFTEIGLGITRATSGSIGPVVVTQDFGRNGTNYILGVVYRDKNNNGMYDVGEGVPGVTITPSTGSFYAVTSSSGGYAIPMGTNYSGTVTVVASGAGVNETKQVSMSSQNVKVDFGKSTTPPPVLISPDNQSMLSTNSATCTWNTVSGATKYHVQVATDDQFTKIVKSDSNLSSATVNVSGLKANTMYYWHVRAFNPSLGWGEYSVTYVFTVSVPLVILSFPPDSKPVGTDTTRMLWFSVKGATKYWLQVSNQFDFSSFVLNDSTLTDTTTIVRKLILDSNYFWRVAAYHSTLGWSDFSAQFVFTIMILPDAVTLLSPPRNAIVPNKQFIFRWSKSSLDVQRYWIEIAADTEFFDIRISDDQLRDTSFNLQSNLNAIGYDTVYYWHVAAIKSETSQSPWTETRSFKVSKTGSGVDDNPIVIRAIAPNPTVGIAVIEYTMPASGHAEFDLWDALGNRVATLLDQPLDAGVHHLALDFSTGDLASLASGVYYLHSNAGGVSSVRQIILHR